MFVQSSNSIHKESILYVPLMFVQSSNSIHKESILYVPLVFQRKVTLTSTPSLISYKNHSLLIMYYFMFCIKNDFPKCALLQGKLVSPLQGFLSRKLTLTFPISRHFSSGTSQDSSRSRTAPRRHHKSSRVYDLAHRYTYRPDTSLSSS